jgi:Cu2+-exporting ATPase
MPEAVAAIRDLGYGVDTIKKTFPVTGMSCASCASCAASVESIMKAQPGVVSAGVNYAASTAQVEYVPGMAHVVDFKKAIQSVGYDLITDESDEAVESLEALQGSHAKALRNKTILSVLFSVPLVPISMFFMSIPYATYIEENDE